MNARHIKCTIEEYHALPEFGRSQHTMVFESPELFEGTYISHIYPHEWKAAWDTGTVAHACFLEPGNIDNVVRIIPADVLNNQGHRKGANWLAWKAGNAGYIYQTAKEFAAIERMIAAVHEHEDAQMLFDHAIHFEHTIIWEDQETGLPLRARPDMICEFPAGLVVSDFKTTRSVKERQFCFDAGDYGYHRQQAMYSEAVETLFGRPVIKFPFICVDKKPPYSCEVFTLSQRDLKLGQRQNQEIRRDFQRRLETNDWHSEGWGRCKQVYLPERAHKEE